MPSFHTWLFPLFIVDWLFFGPDLMYAIVSAVPCQNLLFWALNWVTPWKTRTHWSYGKLSLVILQMELKWYLISSWVVESQNGSARLALSFAFLMDMMVRGLNILVQDWSAFFRYYFVFFNCKDAGTLITRVWSIIHTLKRNSCKIYCKLALPQPFSLFFFSFGIVYAICQWWALSLPENWLCCLQCLIFSLCHDW